MEATARTSEKPPDRSPRSGVRSDTRGLGSLRTGISIGLFKASLKLMSMVIRISAMHINN